MDGTKAIVTLLRESVFHLFTLRLCCIYSTTTLFLYYLFDSSHNIHMFCPTLTPILHVSQRYMWEKQYSIVDLGCQWILLMFNNDHTGFGGKFQLINDYEEEKYPLQPHIFQQLVLRYKHSLEGCHIEEMQNHSCS